MTTLKKKKTSLSIILPVFNERDTIEPVLKEWSSFLTKQKMTYEFVICEDGSTDGTKELLKKLVKKYPITLSQKKKRRGYGGAVMDGIKAATSEYILCVDSDGQCDPKDLTKFWKIRDSRDVLIGWRTKRADVAQRKLFSSSFKAFFKLLYPTPIHDPSAPFVLFKKQTIMPYMKYLVFLKEGFWWGFVGMCVKKNLSIKELPMHHRERFNGETQVYKMKKIPSIALRNLRGLIQLKMAS